MPADLPTILFILGHVLLGGLFVLGGIKHFFQLDMLTGLMAARGVPYPRLVLIAGSLFQIAAGGALMTGFFVAEAAIGLIVFTLAASWMFLNFWSMEGAMRENTFNICMTNVALIGGLLIAAAGAM